MLIEPLNLLDRIWFPALLGTGLMLVGAGAGWAIAGEPHLSPVRLITWWVLRVVRPLLRCRSWWRCAGAIFLNNASLLTALVAAGRWRASSLAATAALGVSLGIGFRVLSKLPGDLAVPWPLNDSRVQRRIRWGVALNLLEPPAIMLAIGLSLDQSSTEVLASESAWTAFALVVIPLTLAAAGGEALWLASSRAMVDSGDGPAPDQGDDSLDG